MDFGVFRRRGSAILPSLPSLVKKKMKRAFKEGLSRTVFQLWYSETVQE